MKNIINKSFLFTALLNIFICSCSTQNNLDLNLTDISFYKLSLNELTLNEVTDIFGPPTATNNNPLAPDLINIIGVQVYYHNIGLMFWFNPKNSNSEQTLRLLKIHLVKKWDQDYNEFFLPFTGTISPHVDPTMKINSLISIFKNYEPELVTAAEARKIHEKRMQTVGINNQSEIIHDYIKFETETGSVRLSCDELTKFLEYLTIVLKH